MDAGRYPPVSSHIPARLRLGMVEPPSTSTAGSIFISYRRTVSDFLARCVHKELTQSGFDVFLDVESMNNGCFERSLLAEVAAREHFIVILQQGSLDRVSGQQDWLCREVAQAVAYRRNIVPLVVDPFHFPKSPPAEIAELCSFNAIRVSHEYFPEAMGKLRTRFLNIPRSTMVRSTDPTHRARHSRGHSPEPTGATDSPEPMFVDIMNSFSQNREKPQPWPGRLRRP